MGGDGSVEGSEKKNSETEKRKAETGEGESLSYQVPFADELRSTRTRDSNSHHPGLECRRASRILFSCCVSNT